MLIPAIDLKDQNCVRLKQGCMDKVTLFSKTPSKVAIRWLKNGAKRLHIVDLNGAFSGKPENDFVILEILKDIYRFSIEKNIDFPIIQVGGGIRDMKTIERYVENNISYIILGTSAIKNPIFLYDACREFPGKIIVGLDIKEGKIAVNGWNEFFNYSVGDLNNVFLDYGCSSVIYTDITRDGMMSGVDVNFIKKVLSYSLIPAIISGGVRDLNDIKTIYSYQNNKLHGIICGRSIYEGILDFKKAQNFIDNL